MGGSRINPAIVVAVLMVPLAGPASATVIFDDGNVHNIDYVIAQGVVVSDSPTGQGTTVNFLTGSEVSYVISCFGHGAVTLDGGQVDWLVGYGQSALTALSGSAAVIGPVEDGSLDVLGGDFNTVVVDGNGEVTITGGAMFDLMASGGAMDVFGGQIISDVEANGASVVTFHGSGFNYPYGPIPDLSGTLTGTLASGDSLSIGFNRSTGTIVLVPEPLTMSLMAAGGVSLLRRRQR